MNNYLKKKNEQTLFEEASSFKDFFQMPFWKQDTMLKTDVIENKDSYTLIMDVPGCRKEDVKISSEDGYLTIEVDQSNGSEITGANYIKRERMHGTYSRSYYIGTNVDTKQISADFSNGTLQVSFPREKNNSTTTYIPIKEK